MCVCVCVCVCVYVCVRGVCEGVLVDELGLGCIGTAWLLRCLGPGQ